MAVGLKSVAVIALAGRQEWRALASKRPGNYWAARYNTWLFIELTPKGIVFFFLFSWQLLLDDAHVQCHVIQSAMSPLRRYTFIKCIPVKHTNWLAESKVKMPQLSKMPCWKHVVFAAQHAA